MDMEATCFPRLQSKYLPSWSAYHILTPVLLSCYTSPLTKERRLIDASWPSKRLVTLTVSGKQKAGSEKRAVVFELAKQRATPDVRLLVAKVQAPNKVERLGEGLEDAIRRLDKGLENSSSLKRTK